VVAVRRAKIVCTLGPATSSPERIVELAEAGMDVARLNMSHGEHSEHERACGLVREASERTGKAIGVLADLQGPKIRIGRFTDGAVTLAAGATLTITTNDVPGDCDIVSTTYDGLPRDVSAGDNVLLDDGALRLRVVDVTETDVTTEIEVGGTLTNNKGINLPGIEVSAPALSDKDVEDLRLALSVPVDWVALSFVRHGSDVDAVRKVMDEVGVHLPVIAKIEKPQAVDNLDEVIDAFDGFMVARGDLGVELPLEDVPIVQKRVVDRARRSAKPVIVATQMLESMISSPRPTRAEASDVANAVLDGADAVMLSGETSVGNYPVDAVETMARIIVSTEAHGVDEMAAIDWRPRTRGGIVCRAASQVAEAVGARLVVAFTQSGDSARRLARYRGPVPVIAFTPVSAVRAQLALTWGVETFQTPSVEHTDEMVMQVDHRLLEIGRVGEGDEVVIVAGSPPGIPGSTNAMRIHRMGDAINEVAPAYRRVAHP